MNTTGVGRPYLLAGEIWLPYGRTEFWSGSDPFLLILALSSNQRVSSIDRP